MFKSLSSCTPNSTVTTSFQSKDKQLLDIWSNVEVKVNGQVSNQRPILINIADVVEATVTAPSAYLGYKFYSYFLNGQVQTFAVVNKNNYTNITVKAADSRKRWYNYIPKNFTISYYGDVTQQDYLLGYGRQLIDVDELHIVLDPQNKAVVFYSAQRKQISRVELPDSPVNYKKIPADDIFESYTQELLVLCANGQLFRIKFDTRYIYSDEFKPAALPVFPLEDLPYLQDLPNGGSWTDAARAKFLKSLFPVVSALDYRNNTIWIAGSNTVYICNKNFVLQNTITLGSVQILDIACIGSNAIVVTKDQNIYLVTSIGTAMYLYSGSALGSPCSFPNGDYVAVPDSNNRRLIIFAQNLSYTYWSTGDMLPAYAQFFDNYLWVTGHDDYRAFKFENANSYREFNFNLRTALVSVVNSSVLGIHCLQDFGTLENINYQRVIPYQPEIKKGPVSHVGSRPHRIKLLGRDLIYAIPGPGVTCWVNGKLNNPISNDDWITASFRVPGPGTFRTNFILGENAIDYDVVGVSSADLRDHFKANLSSEYFIAPPYTHVPVPPIGTKNQGITYLNLGFDFKIYGNNYSNIGVTTNGYIGFGSNVPIITDPEFGTVSCDAIYAEPKDLYQGYPINNVNPLNIVDGILDTNQVPGVYYRYDDYGLFQGARVRWVGTAMSSFPLGNLNYNTTTISNWEEIPIRDYANININDYVSGSGIVTSTKVIDKIYFYLEANTYSYGANLSTILLNSLTPNTNIGITNLIVKRYSDFKIDGNLYAYVNNQNIQSFEYSPVLYQISNTIYLDGLIDTAINNKFEFVFWYPTGSLKTIVTKKTNLFQLATFTDSVTTLRYYASTAHVLVSLIDYNKQFLFGVTVVGTSSKLISKNLKSRTITVLRSYQYQSDPVTVQFSITTVNVPSGFVIPYTISGSGLVLDDFNNLSALNGNITINNNVASISLQSNITLALKQASISFGTISDINTTLLSTSFFVGNSQSFINEIDASGPSIVSPAAFSTGSTEYAINFSQDIGPRNPGNLITILSTTATFQSLPESVTGRNLTTIYNEVLLDRNVTLNYPYTVEFEGNFVQVSNSTTISSSTELLFKANVPAPTYTYEVGFYTGRNFQYVEISYDSQYHQANTTIGIATGDPDFYQVKSNVVTGKTRVFGSYAFFGDWVDLGIGKFDTTISGYFPRELEFVQVKSESNVYAKFEAVVEQKFPATSNVFVSLNYGFLSINQNEDIYSRPLRIGDIITVNVPVGQYKTSLVPLLSIGDFQQAIPTITEENANQYPVITSITENVSPSTYSTGNVTVNQTGEYYIPQYSRFVESNPDEFVFKRIRNGITSVLSGVVHSFLANDIIQVENIYTSNRIYDTRTISIVGPSVLSIVLRTSAGSTFNFMNFGTLTDPYTRMYEMEMISSSEYQEQLRYQSTNITALSTTGLTAPMAIGAPGISVFINGTSVTPRQFNLSSGSTIGLEWTVLNYFQNNVSIYQVAIDPVDSSNVYIPVGLWSINNRSVINEPVLTGQATALSVKEFAELIPSQTTSFGGPFKGLDPEPDTVFKDRIVSSFMASNGFQGTGRITSQYQKSPNDIVSTSSTAELEPNDGQYPTGRIASQSVPSQTTMESDAILAKYQNQTAAILSKSANASGIASGAILTGHYYADYIKAPTVGYGRTGKEFTKPGTIIEFDSSTPDLYLPPTEFKSENPSEYKNQPNTFVANIVSAYGPTPNQIAIETSTADLVEFNFYTQQTFYDIVLPNTIVSVGPAKEYISQGTLFTSSEYDVEREEYSVYVAKNNLQYFYNSVFEYDGNSPDFENYKVFLFGNRYIVKETFVDYRYQLTPDDVENLQFFSFDLNQSLIADSSSFTQASDIDFYEINLYYGDNTSQYETENSWLHGTQISYIDTNVAFLYRNLIFKEEPNLQKISITPEFNIVNTRLFSFTSQYEVKNPQLFPITSIKELPNPRLLPIQHQYEVPNPRLLPIQHQYELPNPRLLPITPSYEVPNPRLLPIVHQYLIPTPRMFTLSHEFQRQQAIWLPIQQKFIIANPLPFKLPAKLNVENPIMRSLPHQYQVPKMILKELEHEFHEGISWEMPDFKEYGVVDQYYVYFYPGGRGGDNLLNLGPYLNPFNKKNQVSALGNNLNSLAWADPQQNKGPYLFYEGAQGSALLKGSQSGVFYIHSGNVLTHINGTNYHYEVDYTHSNINVSSWTLGSGTVPGYFAVGESSENIRILADDPWGQKNIIWKATGDGSGDHLNGGWDGDWFAVDPNKAYRSVVWVKRVSTAANGIIYHGMVSNGTAPAYPNTEVDGDGNPITVGNVVRIADNLAEWDPYWSSVPASSYEKDQWYLHVGVVYPRNYPDPEPIDQMGIYNSSGRKVMENNGKLPQGGKFPQNTTHARQRVFALYSFDSDTVFHFAFPRFEVLDMGQPTVPALCRLPETKKFLSNATVATVDSVTNTLLFGGQTYSLDSIPGKNYGTGGYRTYEEAVIAANKFQGGVPIKVINTDYWNYRIYFDYVTAAYRISASSTTNGTLSLFTEMGETVRFDATGLDCDEVVSYRIDPALVELSYVLVGAGGGGGSAAGGGGGGGAVYYGLRSNIELEKDYPVTIGAGGIGGRAATTSPRPLALVAMHWTSLMMIGGAIKKASSSGFTWNNDLITYGVWSGKLVEWAWSGTFSVPLYGIYDVTMVFDDFATVKINGNFVINNIGPNPGSNVIVEKLTLTAGAHTITVSARNLNGAVSEFNPAGFAMTIYGPVASVVTPTVSSTSGSASLFMDIEALGGGRGGDGLANIRVARFVGVTSPAVEGVSADQGVWMNQNIDFNETFFVNLPSGNYGVYSVSSGTHSVHIDDLPTLTVGNIANRRYTKQFTISNSGQHRLRIFADYVGPGSYIAVLITSLAGDITYYNLRSIIDADVNVTLAEVIPGAGGMAGGGGGGSNFSQAQSGAGGVPMPTMGNSGGAGTTISGGGGGGAGGPGTNGLIVPQAVFEANNNVNLGNVRLGQALAIGVAVAGDGGPGESIFQECWTIGAGGGGGTYFYSNADGMFGGNRGLYGGGLGGAITSGHGGAGQTQSGAGGGGGFVHAVYGPETIVYVPELQKDSEGNLILDTNGNPMPVLDGSGNPVPAVDSGGNLIVDRVDPPQLISSTEYNGGNGAGGVLMLKYSKEYDIYLDPGLSYETLEMSQDKLTVIYAGIGNIRFKVPCFPVAVYRGCSPGRGPVFPVKWLIRGG